MSAITFYYSNDGDWEAMSFESTQRIRPQRQTLMDAYSPPANYLEIEVCNAVTHIDENGKRFTDYEVRMRTNLPIFRLKEFSTRRRYSDFAWLKNELENSVAIVIPPLPGKAMMKQLPFLKNDDGIFEADFIEDRRQSLEEFINKVAGHPLVQSERSVHAFLQEVNLNRADFVPGKVNFPQY